MQALESDFPSFEELPRREQQVLDLAAQGFTDRQMATELGISTETVATYWRRILVRYKASSRTQVLARVMERRFEELVFHPEPALGITAAQAKLSWKAIRDHLPQGILLETLEGRVVFTNLAFARMLGKDNLGALIGRKTSDVLRGHPIASVYEVVSGSSDALHTVTIPTPEASELKVTRIPIPDAGYLWHSH